MQAISEGRWRRGRDSNPRYPSRYGRFRGGSFQPLTHLSARENEQTLIVTLHSFFSKERLHHLHATPGQHSARYFYAVIQLGMVQHLHH